MSSRQGKPAGARRSNNIFLEKNRFSQKYLNELLENMHSEKKSVEDNNNTPAENTNA